MIKEVNTLELLISETEKTFDIYGDAACPINGKTGYELNIRRLAIIILSGAKNTLQKVKDEQIECETIKVKDYDEECLQRRIINEKNNSLINNHPIVHNMKLYSDAFYYIKEQNKRVKLRLDDEKRQKLRVGDYIEFVAVNTNEKILVKITKLNHFKNFNDLYDAYPNKIVLGYKEGEVVSPNDMLDYYKIEDINLYGGLAIEFEVLNK